MLGITPPEVLKGFTQSPIEGESFAEAIKDPEAGEKEVQFYSMLGQRALYYKGWLVNTLHPPISGWGRFEHDVWELALTYKKTGPRCITLPINTRISLRI